MKPLPQRPWVDGLALGVCLAAFATEERAVVYFEVALQMRARRRVSLSAGALPGVRNRGRDCGGSLLSVTQEPDLPEGRAWHVGALPRKIPPGAGQGAG